MAWRILKILTFTGVALILVAMSVLVIGSRAQGGKILSIQSGSMEPIIKKGDAVMVNRVPDYSLAVGDVITYTDPVQPKVTITHRIVQLPSVANHYQFLTKGDANQRPDVPIASAAIIGKVEHRIPYAGFALDTIRKPIGLAIIIYIPALLIVVSEIRRLSQYYRKERPYILAGRSAHSH